MDHAIVGSGAIIAAGAVVLSGTQVELQLCMLACQQSL